MEISGDKILDFSGNSYRLDVWFNYGPEPQFIMNIARGIESIL